MEERKAHWNIPEARAKARISSRIIHNNTLLPRVRLIKKSRARNILSTRLKVIKINRKWFRGKLKKQNRVH